MCGRAGGGRRACGLGAAEGGRVWTGVAWTGALRPGLGRHGGGDWVEAAAAGIGWRRRVRPGGCEEFFL